MIVMLVAKIEKKSFVGEGGKGRERRTGGKGVQLLIKTSRHLHMYTTI